MVDDESVAHLTKRNKGNKFSADKCRAHLALAKSIKDALKMGIVGAGAFVIPTMS